MFVEIEWLDFNKRLGLSRFLFNSLVVVHWLITVCFFAIVTKEDGITQPNDFTPMSAINAINQFEVYCLAFLLICSKIFLNDF